MCAARQLTWDGAAYPIPTHAPRSVLVRLVESALVLGAVDDAFWDGCRHVWRPKPPPDAPMTMRQLTASRVSLQVLGCSSPSGSSGSSSGSSSPVQLHAGLGYECHTCGASVSATLLTCTWREGALMCRVCRVCGCKCRCGC